MPFNLFNLYFNVFYDVIFAARLKSNSINFMNRKILKAPADKIKCLVKKKNPAFEEEWETYHVASA